MNPALNITLIGMPAVGKSTLGVLLAKRINFGFVDTDLLIQTGENAGLQQIIHDVGIDKFCDLEARYIQHLSTQRTVIATGGSVVYRSRAMNHLKKLGLIVHLDIELAPLCERLKGMDNRGVVHLPGQTVEQLYAQRRPLYQKYAQLTVNCTHCSHEEAVQKLFTASHQIFK